MTRVNYPLTLDQLISEALKAKRKFGGNKYVLISDDEEGNGFHECYYTFNSAAQAIDPCCISAPTDLALEDCVVLG